MQSKLSKIRAFSDIDQLLSFIQIILLILTLIANFSSEIDYQPKMFYESNFIVLVITRIFYKTSVSPCFYKPLEYLPISTVSLYTQLSRD